MRYQGRRREMRIDARKLPIVAVAMALLQCACTPSGHHGSAPAANSPAAQDATTPSANAGAYIDRSRGFRIEVPSRWTAHRDFAHGYLANDSWKAYAAPDSQGTAIVSFTLPGSNEITSAEIRIGASRGAGEIAQCTVPPDSLRAGSLHQERIGDVDFTAFEAADAAMSHHLDVRGYRAVHDGACYAIDLLVYGTNPEVYDPPPKPPFSKDAAFARMTPVLRTFRFTR